MEYLFKKAVDALLKKNLTVTFAESCTGGLLAKYITDVPGASAVFPGSAVTYSNEIKKEVVFVSEDTIEKYTEVSHLCAREMAEGAKKRFKTDLAVSVTGYAGPGGGTDENPVGTVYVGLSNKNGAFSYRLYFPGKSREQIREAVAAFSAYIIECEAEKF